MKMGDLVDADDAVRKIIMLYPASLYRDRLQLLFGQELSRTNQQAEARAIFTELSRTFPNSPRWPQVQMALALSYELENNWTAAIHAYDAVLKRSPTNDIAPSAEFRRALAYDHAGRETNTLTLLTNFLARFPTNEFALRAQDWIGDYFYRNEDFAEAERNYQRLYQNTNWLPGELTFQAKLKAGRAAVMRQGYDDAITYFLGLINDKQCPTNILAEAFFAYGDTLITKPPGPDSTNVLARFETALETFRKITQICASSPLGPPALGRIGDCYFQLASQDPRRYTNALEFYEKALAMQGADQTTRSQAEVGAANTLARLAQLKATPDPELFNAALAHFLNVVYGRNLRDDEAPAPLWAKEAGLAAAKILESQKRWIELINLCQRLQELVPPLRPALEKKIKAAREQLGGKGD